LLEPEEKGDDGKKPLRGFYHFGLRPHPDSGYYRPTGKAGSG
jgi:hypothetical protein